jgi:hypothetical protein
MEKKQTAVDLLVNILNKEGYICPQTKKQCDDECCVSAEDCHIKASIGILSESKQETLELKMSKQTAVEWLVKEYRKVYGVDSFYVMELNIEHAKQMEKEQIEMACNQQEFEDIDGLGICETISKGQQYYNEIYGETK